MWVRDVELPEGVVSAHQAGRLVLFVGAGASKAAPSELPDFRELTKAIADESQFPTAGRLHQPDQVLGDLEALNVDVHHRVAVRIGIDTSRPNRLHTAIAALAEAGGPVRIVTTNYDRHIGSSLDPALPTVTVYRAPALPMGDDFTGLVYLHGSLDQPDRELVCTDADFGRAYLRDAWAARFLERMFSTFTVLFIGYSHDDVVMTYLARALGRSSERYALTDDPDAPHWRRLNIGAVAYPNQDGTHESLVDGLEKWAAQSAMKLLDHRQQIARLVAAAPSPVPDEVSYLEAAITEEARLRFFTEHARGLEWLQWAATQPAFRALFNPAAPGSELDWLFANWFAEHYVNSTDFTGAALRVLRDAGGQMSPTLRQAIGTRLHMETEPRPSWLGPWIVLMVQPPWQPEHDLLDYALNASRWPDDRDAAVLLFDHLTEPRAYLESGFDLGEAPRFDIALRGSDHWLRETWTTLFQPNLTDLAPTLIAISDRHLRKTHQMLTVAGTANDGWDPISFSRSAVAPHGQDRYPAPAGILIDVARDCLETLLDDGNDVGLGYLTDWVNHRAPLLKRLGLHGWAHRTDVSATAKLTWLRETGWLHDHELRHEVFALIKATLAEADRAVADALVADAVIGPPDVGEDHLAYEIFNSLAWLVRSAPDLPSASAALAIAKEANPHFLERDNPDLTSWSESGSRGSQPPMATEDLHEKIRHDVAAAVAELRTFEDKTSPFHGPTWHDALTLLGNVVGTWPEDGFAVHDLIGDEHPEMLSAVIAGWEKGALDDDQAEEIVTRLAGCDLSRITYAVSRLLADVGTGESIHTDWPAMPSARPLAVALWRAVGDDGEQINASRALNSAINDTSGRIAEFWVLATSSDWRVAGEAWDGLPTQTREQLEGMLTAGGRRSAMVEVILVSRLHFFFGADSAWCQAHLMPLLRFEDRDRALRVWDGFLGWGRWNDQMLEAGLLEGYLAAAGHLEDLGEDLTRQLCMHLAHIALESDLHPIDQGWASRFTTAVTPEVRAQWFDQIEHVLTRLPAEAIKYQWDRWMRRYWHDRLESVPVQLTHVEASALANWVTHMRSDIHDAVGLATRAPAGLQPHSDLLQDLAEADIAAAPVEYARLIAHLLAGTTAATFYGGHKVRDLVPWLRTHLPADSRDALLAAIVEKAIGAGCNDAPQW